MNNLSDYEINHLVATKVNGWEHLESVFYKSSDGQIQVMADYCNSIAHALDLAHEWQVGLMPISEGWSAYDLQNSENSAHDKVAGKAICLCLLKMFDVTTPQVNPTIEEITEHFAESN